MFVGFIAVTENMGYAGKDNLWLQELMGYCKDRSRKAGEEMASWEDAADRIETYINKESVND